MKFFIIIFGLLFSHSVLAEDTTIDMLNKGEDRSMVFSKEIVRIDAVSYTHLTLPTKA